MINAVRLPIFVQCLDLRQQRAKQVHKFALVHQTHDWCRNRKLMIRTQDNWYAYKKSGQFPCHHPLLISLPNQQIL